MGTRNMHAAVLLWDLADLIAAVRIRDCHSRSATRASEALGLAR